MNSQDAQTEAEKYFGKEIAPEDEIEYSFFLSSEGAYSHFLQELSAMGAFTLQHDGQFLYVARYDNGQAVVTTGVMFRDESNMWHVFNALGG